MDYDLVKKCVYTGLFSLVIGIITEIILSKLGKTDNILTKTKSKNNTLFFIYAYSFGFILRYFLEIIGFEAYCEQKCIQDKCKYVCTLKINK
jgi:hypothetical protein